jgi:hypothetical protein
MFGKFLKGLKTDNNPVKQPSTTSSGRGQISALQEAQAKAKESRDESEKKLETILQEAIESLEAFGTNQKKSHLKTSIEKLMAYLEIKKSNHQPYFYLGIIAYISGDLQLMSKYLDIAAEINPDFLPLKNFREQLKQLPEENTDFAEEEDFENFSEIIDSELLAKALPGADFYDYILFDDLEDYEAINAVGPVNKPKPGFPVRPSIQGNRPVFKPSVKPINNIKR